MATPAYMTIKIDENVLTAGASTVESIGNIFQEGHKDEVMVQAFSHEIVIPRDPQSGQPTGQRVHRPVVITKVFDKSSPVLLEALTKGTLLTEVTIDWYRTTATGDQENYYTTTLEDAIIVQAKDYMYNCQDPATANFTHLQELQFSYRKITWTHHVASTSGADDWRTQAAAAA